jgi:hypothetical protein
VVAVQPVAEVQIRIHQVIALVVEWTITLSHMLMFPNVIIGRALSYLLIFFRMNIVVFSKQELL